MRSCIGCRESKEKKELLRIVHTPDGELKPDPGGRLPGRGAYICPREECLKAAFRSGTLSKAFRTEVTKEMLEKLREEVAAYV